MNNNCNSDKYVPLDAAKNLIIAALYQYHPELADRAADIFEREGHTIIDNPERVTGMMQCRPAGAEVITDENHDMYISEEDFNARFGPNFTERGNIREHAVIDYEYLGTPNSILYLAHEMGHAIADDIQREKGLTHKDFKWPQQEEQAYFVQSIVSHYTGIPSPENITSDDLKSQFEGSDRPKQFRAAHNRFTDSLSMDSQQRYEQMVMALSGNFDNGGARLQTLTNALANQPANRL
ncbi:MAG: hypothetical protein DI626_09965 [Micavibrio aeruginosavorus]|jgi:hypothetical protein|uniref:Uncharacterized protein n=1 Tax=Micavibrio aeruginosavorus TaxID=349221 RepID=A0A2W4ZJQ8_9BACT|nr:MAG: hypothetical protein DI626_09965 [Micavibrio aeruginosavorus]